MAEKKICLKCLDLSYQGEECCSRCGAKLISFSLACDCGEELSPYIWPRFFPPWGREIINNHCLQCGKDIKRKVWDYIKALKKIRITT